MKMLMFPRGLHCLLVPSGSETVPWLQCTAWNAWATSAREETSTALRHPGALHSSCSSQQSFHGIMAQGNRGLLLSPNSFVLSFAGKCLELGKGASAWIFALVINHEAQLPTLPWPSRQEQPVLATQPGSVCVVDVL